jgi:hypothetical protein
VIGLNLPHIGGHVPSEIGLLTNLETLDLSNSGFTGPITFDLTAIKSLKFMNLSHSSITGIVPTDSSSVNFVVDTTGSAVTYCSATSGECGEPVRARFIRSGFLYRCTVYVDSDGSGTYNRNSPSAITNEEGVASIYGTVDGPLRLSPSPQCIDTGTGLTVPDTMVLVGLREKTCIISPVTTMVVNYMLAHMSQSVDEYDVASAYVLNSMGINNATNINYNYINTALNGSVTGTDVFTAIALREISGIVTAPQFGTILSSIVTAAGKLSASISISSESYGQQFVMLINAVLYGVSTLTVTIEDPDSIVGAVLSILNFIDNGFPNPFFERMLTYAATSNVCGENSFTFQPFIKMSKNPQPSLLELVSQGTGLYVIVGVGSVAVPTLVGGAAYLTIRARRHHARVLPTVQRVQRVSVKSKPFTTV